MADFSHLDESGRARMVDVSAKDDTVRVATARGRVLMAARDLAARYAPAAWPRATCWPSPRSPA